MGRGTSEHELRGFEQVFGRGRHSGKPVEPTRQAAVLLAFFGEGEPEALTDDPDQIRLFPIELPDGFDDPAQYQAWAVELMARARETPLSEMARGAIQELVSNACYEEWLDFLARAEREAAVLPIEPADDRAVLIYWYGNDTPGWELAGNTDDLQLLVWFEADQQNTRLEAQLKELPASSAVRARLAELLF